MAGLGKDLSDPGSYREVRCLLCRAVMQREDDVLSESGFREKRYVCPKCGRERRIVG